MCARVFVCGSMDAGKGGRGQVTVIHQKNGSVQFVLHFTAAAEMPFFGRV